MEFQFFQIIQDMVSTNIYKYIKFYKKQEFYDNLFLKFLRNIKKSLKYIIYFFFLRKIYN